MKNKTSLSPTVVVEKDIQESDFVRGVRRALELANERVEAERVLPKKDIWNRAYNEAISDALYQLNCVAVALIPAPITQDGASASAPTTTTTDHSPASLPESESSISSKLAEIRDRRMWNKFVADPDMRTLSQLSTAFKPQFKN